MMFNFYKLCHNSTCRYNSQQWLDESHDRVPPHRDMEVVRERKKCFEIYFSNEVERRRANEEYATYSACLEDFL